MLGGFTQNFKPLKLLSDKQVEIIKRGTLDILEKTGVRIEHEGAQRVFAENGCKVDFDKKRVKIPGRVVENCLSKCPDSFIIRARDPGNNISIGGNVLYFENSIGMKAVSLDTWSPHIATMPEQIEGVKVLDSLENMHVMNVYASYSEIEGVSPYMAALEDLASRITNSTKCQAAGCFKQNEIFAIRMGKVVDIDLIGTVNAISPLTYGNEAAEAIFRFAGAGFPINFGSGAVMGITGPATIAGATVTNNAELLAGIVLAQLINPGTRILVSDSVYPMDIRRGYPAFGAVEAAMHNMVFNQIWHSYKIPTSSWISGITSSKKIDFQCAYERAMTGLLCALSGSNIISLHGAIYGEMTWNPVQAVLDDDIAGWIGRFIEGVEVTDETLAIDLIQKVGPFPGKYLASKHTRKWLEKEQLIPDCADRDSYPEWLEKGKRDSIILAKEKLKKILAGHKIVVLSQEKKMAIDEIIKEARVYYSRE